MTYENYLNWAEGTHQNIMPKYEFLRWQKDQVVNKAQHNKELLQALYNKKPIPEGIKLNSSFDNDYDLVYGTELEIGKKYHILFKILGNGYTEGNETYPDWYFKVNNYNALYYGFEGITEHKYNSRKPYNFRLNDDDLFLIKEIKG